MCSGLIHTRRFARQSDLSSALIGRFSAVPCKPGPAPGSGPVAQFTTPSAFPYNYKTAAFLSLTLSLSPPPTAPHRFLLPIFSSSSPLTSPTWCRTDVHSLPTSAVLHSSSQSAHSPSTVSFNFDDANVKIDSKQLFRLTLFLRQFSRHVLEEPSLFYSPCSLLCGFCCSG